jgi:hypothetical protein
MYYYKYYRLIFIFICFTLLFFSICVSQRLTFYSETLQESIAQIGDKYPGIITVKNEREKPIILKVYQTDQFFYCNGSITYDDPDSNKNPRSSAKWIFCPSFLRIPAKGISHLNYHVQVPNDPLLVGTYWSVIMIEASNEKLDSIQANLINADTKKRKTMGMALLQKYRYAFTIVTHIGNTGIRKIDMQNVKLLKMPDQDKVLQFNIENNGERGFCIPSVWVEVYNSSTGMKILNNGKEKFEGINTKTLPTTCVQQNINLGKILGGFYKAMIYFDGGGDDLFGFQYELNVE